VPESHRTSLKFWCSDSSYRRTVDYTPHQRDPTSAIQTLLAVSAAANGGRRRQNNVWAGNSRRLADDDDRR
jgi:hypothetical protein